jgi:hypothetical protein
VGVKKMKRLGKSTLSNTPKRIRKKLTPLQKSRKRKLRNYLLASGGIDEVRSSQEGIITPSVRLYSQSDGFKAIITFWDVSEKAVRPLPFPAFQSLSTRTQVDNINILKTYLRKRNIKFNVKKTERQEYINWRNGIKMPKTHNHSIKFSISNSKIDKIGEMLTTELRGRW